MASPNAPFLANSAVSIINPRYCASSQMDLAVARKVKILSFGNFVVTDINDNIIFKVEGAFLSFHARRVLLDPAGNPIVTLQNKKMSSHHRWEAYRGDSTDTSNLLFSAKRSSMFQFKKELDVFVARNTEENVCDFKVKGSWLKRSCVIYAKESSTIVAQMHKKHTVQLFGKDNFTVTVYQNVDYAFIIALIVILDGINHAENN